MVRALFIVFFLLLELQPLAGAAICIERVPSGADCPMPEDSEPTHGSPTHSPAGQIPGGSPLCQAIAFCVGGPALAVAAEGLSQSAPVQGASIVFESTLHSADPVAPPAPPPNS